MSNELFKTVLFLPSQAAAETEATIVKWLVSEGDSFSKGQVLAEAESAKSTFEFEAPCDGTVVSLLLADGGQYPNPAIANLQDSLRAIALGVAYFDAMQSFDSDLAHLVGDRVRAVPGQAIHAGPHEKVGPDVLGFTEQLIDITFQISQKLISLSNKCQNERPDPRNQKLISISDK